MPSSEGDEVPRSLGASEDDGFLGSPLDSDNGELSGPLFESENDELSGPPFDSEDMDSGGHYEGAMMQQTHQALFRVVPVLDTV